MELTLLQEALGKNPKIYCVWYHRKWVFKQGLLPASALEQELKLCAKVPGLPAVC